MFILFHTKKANITHKYKHNIEYVNADIKYNYKKKKIHLKLKLFKQLPSTWSIQSIWFKHDGCPAHNIIVFHKYLDTIFPGSLNDQLDCLIQHKMFLFMRIYKNCLQISY